ncbi:MAG TPA: ABC transporter ATP-binding protein [Pirellulaceae bacterium]|nr:ABC transporter ATP-binding protein [Pirellulaceae bacterium]HMO91874.1 ABC transporter ATP-binding protein [Pirellulaceae bacterium]HMP69716.1 ABC transporter ATP-binding protein [Pirellulaceae bacterium]
MPIIDIKKLSKTYRVYQKKEGLLASLRGLVHRQYRTIHAVSEIDLTVEQGEFVAFLGPNGAGKTTTLKMLSGVINPSSGQCTVMGFVPWKRENAFRRRMALVMGQKNQLWWDLPAQESFRLHQHIYGIEKGRFEQTKSELADMLTVTELMGQPVRELSLGERMKMELIAALLHSPSVLFLDEPTIGLDVVAQHNIQNFLRHYQQDRKITIILTSHYMKDIAALCRRVVIIAGGTIHYDGSLRGIIDRFGSEKIITLTLAKTESLAGLEKVGREVSIEIPKIKFRLPKDEVAKTLAQVFSTKHVEDIVVEDPPLEEVIARVFFEAEQSMNGGNSSAAGNPLEISRR